MRPSSDYPKSSSVPPFIKRFLLATFLFGALGTGVELALMEHFESFWQQIPLWLIGISLLAVVLHNLFRRVRLILRGFQVLTLLLAIGGLLGVYLHFNGKAEFQKEIDPSLSGWELVWQCLHGHTLPPVLAPGSMILLGMIGFAYARCCSKDRVDLRHAAVESDK